MIFWGLVLVTIGMGLLLDLDWSRVWPFMLIALGGAMVLSALRGGRRGGWLWSACGYGPIPPLRTGDEFQKDWEAGHRGTL